MTNTLVDNIRRHRPALSVGILTADLMRLGSEILILENAGIELLHFDVMDGCYCPMMTFGPPFIKGVKTKMLKDVHLLIDDPIDKIESYAAAGADMITIHPDSCRHPHRVLQTIGKMTNANDSLRGILRGIAINPSVPLESDLEPLIEEVDMIVFLSINPGWGGQKFCLSTERRIKKARELINESGRNILLGVDGGITIDNLANVINMGADVVVTGSAIFDGKNAQKNLQTMIEILKSS